jgi:hypothetical protein
MGPASAALMLEIRMLARIDVARRTRMELLPRFRARFLDAVSSEFSWPEDGRLAQPVQLNTRLLSLTPMPSRKSVTLPGFEFCLCERELVKARSAIVRARVF